MGNAYFNDKQYSQAEEQFQRVVDIKKTEKVYENLVIVSFNLMAKKKLRFWLEKWIEVSKNILWLKFWNIQLNPNHQQLLKITQQLLEKHPEHYYLYSILGM